MSESFKVSDYPIFENGYGIASKYILCDPGLKMASKGSYCYLRSLSGQDSEVVFPGVFKIMEDLGISKDLYYKSRNELINAGIIIIERKKNKGTFDNNTYSFPLQPSRYMVAGETGEAGAYLDSIRNQIREFGVMAKYGLCPYSVMADKELPIGAKVIFAYISAHINVTENPYAELDPGLIQFHLGMSPNTYQKYIKELRKKNYLIVSRVREKGTYKTLNRYAINYSMVKVEERSVPVLVFDLPENASEPTTKKQEMVEAPITKKQETVEAPITKKQETVEAPITNFPEMEKTETKKQETTNTSSTITSFNQIIFDGLIKTIREKISYRIFEFAAEYTPEILKTADLLVDVIVQTLASPNPMVQINGRIYTAEYVREILMQINNAMATNVINRCLAKQDSIRDMKSYLLTSIFNEIEVPTKEEEEDSFDEAF